MDIDFDCGAFSLKFKNIESEDFPKILEDIKKSGFLPEKTKKRGKTKKLTESEISSFLEKYEGQHSKNWFVKNSGFVNAAVILDELVSRGELVIKPGLYRSPAGSIKNMKAYCLPGDAAPTLYTFAKPERRQIIDYINSNPTVSYSTLERSKAGGPQTKLLLSCMLACGDIVLKDTTRKLTNGKLLKFKGVFVK